MKILILHKQFVMGGIERVLFNYLNIFKLLDYKVDLLVTYDLGQENIFFRPLPDNCRVDFILNNNFVDEMKKSNNKKKSSIFHYFLYKYQKYSKKSILVNKITERIAGDYDLIIDFNDNLNFFIDKGYLQKIKKHPPIIRWEHGSLNVSANRTAKKLAYFRRIYSNFDRVITIASAMKLDLIHKLQMDDKYFATIYNPLDLNDINQKSTDSIDFHFPYFLQVSRLTDIKGHEELLEIYSELRLLGVKHKLLIIGDGENRANLENKITTLGLNEDVYLIGQKENPYPYFKNAYLFLHTSKYEGLPTVLLESMGLSVPVVAMDCPTGPKDILGNNEYGLLVKMHDTKEFINAVLSLLYDDEKYQVYTRLALERATEFGFAKIAQEIDMLFKEIIRNH